MLLCQKTTIMTTVIITIIIIIVTIIIIITCKQLSKLFAHFLFVSSVKFKSRLV